MRLTFVATDGLCRVCGRGAVALTGDFLCEDCRREKPFFDRGTSVFSFESDVRELVNAFKFREFFALRDDFVDALEARARAYFRVDEIACVVPIPSVWWSRWLRGYAPSSILASVLAARLGKPAKRLLRRVGNPRKQGGLTAAQRRENVVDSFAVTPTAARMLRSIGDKPVLLVDDVMTTGSTLSEAAKTLKSAGVKTVWTISLARSVYT